MLRSFLFAALLAPLVLMTASPSSQAEPVRVAIVRLTHDHVFWLLARPKDRGDVQIIGVYEPNEKLAEERADKYGIDRSLLYTDLDEMLSATKPEAAVHFGNIAEHHDHTLACVERGVHVMVEKPLALSLAEARSMADAARTADVQLLTNYETTWYPNNRELKRRLDAGDLGGVRRLVFRTGHRGPIEIGCRDVFLEWLLDPELNGGGAITDFGCYGANLATWFFDGERPQSVWAETKTLKPDLYPRVDDDATIVLNYASSTVVIQPSWNWPMNVKDLRLFTDREEVLTIGNDRLQVLNPESEEEKIAPLQAPQDDPFAHFAAVVRGEIEAHPLCSIENNLVVMELLDAARRSAESGQEVVLKD